jgi:hypothetical protein
VARTSESNPSPARLGREEGDKRAGPARHRLRAAGEELGRAGPGVRQAARREGGKQPGDRVQGAPTDVSRWAAQYTGKRREGKEKSFHKFLKKKSNKVQTHI